MGNRDRKYLLSQTSQRNRITKEHCAEEPFKHALAARPVCALTLAPRATVTFVHMHSIANFPERRPTRPQLECCSQTTSGKWCRQFSPEVASNPSGAIRGLLLKHALISDGSRSALLALLRREWSAITPAGAPTGKPLYLWAIESAAKLRFSWRPSFLGFDGSQFKAVTSGPYKAVPEKPIVDCPDLGLLQTNICDGSYSTTKIFSVSGLPDKDSGRANRGKRSGDDECNMKRIGTFYVQFVGNHAAYDLPGGALTMLFTANNLVPAPDGQGGTYFVGTVDLDIVEATGIFESFVGGHNKIQSCRRITVSTPSGLKATLRTKFQWPDRVSNSLPLSASHTLAVSS